MSADWHSSSGTFGRYRPVWWQSATFLFIFLFRALSSNLSLAPVQTVWPAGHSGPTFNWGSGDVAGWRSVIVSLGSAVTPQLDWCSVIIDRLAFRCQLGLVFMLMDTSHLALRRSRQPTQQGGRHGTGESGGTCTMYRFDVFMFMFLFVLTGIVLTSGWIGVGTY